MENNNIDSALLNEKEDNLINKEEIKVCPVNHNNVITKTSGCPVDHKSTNNAANPIDEPEEDKDAPCIFASGGPQTKNDIDDIETGNSSKKCCFVELNKGVSYFNLITYYIVQFSYVCAATFIDACQGHLLSDEKYYNIDEKQVGTINGNILLFDTLYLIVFIYLYGSFHDVFGRKIVVVFGFFSISLSLVLYPLAGNIYPNLILVRLLFANGICAVTTQPLLADYVNHRTKGFCGGIAGVVSGFGAIFAVTVLMGTKKYFNNDIKYVYFTAALLFFVVAIICIFGVKNVTRKDNTPFSVIGLYKKLKEGMEEVAGNTKLIVGIATSTMARMHSILVTLFFVLWVQSYFPKERKNEGYVAGQIILGIGNCVGLVSAIFFGFFFEKASIPNLLFISNLLVMTGYTIFYFCGEPTHWPIFIAIAVICFGFYGLMTVGYIVVNKSCGCKSRGSVMGLNCLFGAVGILIVSKLGGWSFDHIDVRAPFLGTAAFSYIMILVLLIPSVRNKLNL